MGMILGPFIIFWFIMSTYSLKIGYSLLNNMDLIPHVATIYFIAVITLLLYVHLGLNKFKNKESLWAFQIIVFFTINKITFSIYLITLMVHWFNFDFIAQYIVNKNITESIIFIILFTISLGAIIGTFKAGAFMKKYNIKETY